MHRRGWGLCAFDGIENLKQKVEEACSFAKLVGKEKTELAKLEAADAEIKAVLDRDFRGVSLDEKLKLVREYNTLLLKRHRKITSTRVAYTDSMRTVYFANSRGSFFFEERPQVYCGFSSVAREENMIQCAGNSVSSVSTYDAVSDLEDKVTEVADIIVALLSAPKCSGGPQTVILNPRLAGVFAHEAFGHLSEADFLYENKKMRDIMTTGKKMGADNLETAEKMGGHPTGNARAVGRNFPPMLRMTNTYIGNGTEKHRNCSRAWTRASMPATWSAGRR